MANLTQHQLILWARQRRKDKKHKKTLNGRPDTAGLKQLLGGQNMYKMIAEATRDIAEGLNKDTYIRVNRGRHP